MKMYYDIWIVHDSRTSRGRQRKKSW